jgi:outer membrane autotransporter protein
VSGTGTAWFCALDGRERHGAADGFRPFDENTDGGMAGVDYLLHGHFTVGAAFADVRDRLQERTTTDHARVESQRGYLQTRWDQRPGTVGWFATARLGLGSSRIETWRRVEFLEAEGNGSHRAWDASAALSAGRDFQYRRWTLRPFVDAEYVRLTDCAYAERGDSGAELAFARRSSDSLLAGAGLAVSTRFDLGRIALQPEVRVRRTRDFLPGTDGLLASFAGGDRFAAPARRLPRDGTELSAALRAKLGEKLACVVNYMRTDYGQGADYAHVVSGQLLVSF